jgi:acetate kinase
MAPAAKQSILAVNTGSSSVKFQLFADASDLTLLAKGEVENIGSTPVFSATDEQTQRTEHKTLPASCTYESALQCILDWTGYEIGNWQVTSVVHRIVHGGSTFRKSVMVTPDVMEKMKALSPFAPYHQPHNLAGIEIISKIKSEMPQIACFDTAFHSARDHLFTEYALPKKRRDQGIRRYGFHGLSYEWISHTLRRDEPALAAGRVIAAHLGSGASVCGMLNGTSIDTSMGLTALEGLPMGSRCGNLDPGALIYMIRNLGLSAEDAETMLYSESGLLGLSGLSGDVKVLQDSDKPEAQFALDYFSLRTAQFIGEMAVALGGVDGIVFTGGIGENSPIVRDKILARLAFLKPYAVHVIPANEERMMAMHAQACLETHKRS